MEHGHSFGLWQTIMKRVRCSTTWCGTQLRHLEWFEWLYLLQQAWHISTWISWEIKVWLYYLCVTKSLYLKLSASSEHPLSHTQSRVVLNSWSKKMGLNYQNIQKKFPDFFLLYFGLDRVYVKFQCEGFKIYLFHHLAGSTDQLNYCY